MALGSGELGGLRCAKASVDLPRANRGPEDEGISRDVPSLWGHSSIPWNSSVQVFESVDEVEQTEGDAQLEDGKQSKVPNGTVPNGTCSPDSGHPSSQNFSITSGFSERSFSNEDSALETTKSSASSQGRAGGSEPAPQDPDGALQEEKLQGQDSLEGEFPPGGGVDFISVAQSSAAVLRGCDAVALTVVESWADEKQSLVESEDNLSEEPEMESLYPQLDSLAVADLANSEASPVSSTGVTYSVSIGHCWLSL